MYSDRPLTPVGGYGGAREGAGRKPPGYQKPAEAVAYDKARARTETAKAEKMERENLVELGLLVSRAAIAQASATAYAALAQTLRSIGDTLEREGVPTEICAKVEEVVDNALLDHSIQMELLAGTPQEAPAEHARREL